MLHTTTPSPTEMLFSAPAIFGFAVQLLFTFGLMAWGRQVARRQGGGAWWRRASWAPLAALVIGFAGTTSSSPLGISPVWDAQRGAAGSPGTWEPPADQRRL